VQASRAAPPPLGYAVAHPTSSWAFNHVVGPLLVMLLIALPVVVTVNLATRLKRTSRASGKWISRQQLGPESRRHRVSRLDISAASTRWTAQL